MTKLSPSYFNLQPSNVSRAELYKLTLSEMKNPILIWGLHLFDRKNKPKPEARANKALDIITAINKAELEFNTNLTLCIGDYNLTPYEYAMIGSKHFRAVSSKLEARQKVRSNDKLEGHNEYFYNPMWSFMGDWFDNPAGTFYYEGDIAVDYKWQMLDQIIFRPQFLNWIKPPNGIKIVTSLGGLPLYNPNNSSPNISDHFPLFLELNFSKDGTIY